MGKGVQCYSTKKHTCQIINAYNKLTLSNFIPQDKSEGVKLTEFITRSNTRTLHLMQTHQTSEAF